MRISASVQVIQRNNRMIIHFAVTCPLFKHFSTPVIYTTHST